MAKAVAEFARAFITSMPKGKQNTFANRTLPDAVLVAIRKDQPINLTGAFEQPVKALANGGYKEQSIEALVRYVREVYDNFAGEPEKTYVTGTGLDKIGERVDLKTLYNALSAHILESTP